MSTPTASQFTANLKRGCLWTLALILGTWFGLYWLIRDYVETPFQYLLPLLGGSVGLIGLGLIGNAVRSLGNRRLLKRAMRSQRPPGDGRAAFQGFVEPIGPPLRAPFSGRVCIAYKYEILKRVTTTTRSAKGERSTQTRDVTYYDGMHLAPSRIRTTWGEVKLLSFPEIDDFETIRGDPEQGRAFIARTRFKDLGKGPAKLGQALAQFGEIMADDDGTVEVDLCIETPADLEDLVFRETVVPAGERVCAIGRYDRSRNGLVPDPRQGGAALYAGDARRVLVRIGGHVAGAAVFGVLLMSLGFGAALAPVAPATILARLDGPGGWLLDYRAERLSLAIQDQDLAAIDRWLRVGIGERRLASIFVRIYLHRNWDITRALLRAGVDPDARDDNGRTQLMRADGEGARLLLEWGADPNTRDPDGYTPLMMAVTHPDLGATARVLLDAGADPSLRNEAGQSAYDLVASKHPNWLHEDVMARLRDF